MPGKEGKKKTGPQKAQDEYSRCKKELNAVRRETEELMKAKHVSVVFFFEYLNCYMLTRHLVLESKYINHGHGMIIRSFCGSPFIIFSLGQIEEFAEPSQLCYLTATVITKI